MIYTFLSLRTAELAAGALLVALHGLAILHGEGARAWLKSLPRSRAAGAVLLLVAAGWAFALVANMDLGEFSNYRTALMFLVPTAAALTWKFVDEFLAVRALGMLLLLAAEPVLEAAFLRPEKSRLLLVVLAYAWAVLGMFYVGSPYLLRDQIGWLQKSALRWNVAMGSGLLYGFAVLGCAFAQHA